jgi:4-amino-4-deoxy-L-arabinose transferase-like glycosyltransferase
VTTNSKHSREWLWWLALAAIAVVLQLGLAGVGALYNETDGQYAGAAKVMAAGGDWVIPENNGIPRLVKPPLLYWMMATSFRAVGTSEFAARLPGALAVVSWVLVTGALVRTLTQSAPTGFFAGLILLTSLGTATLGRIIMPEPWFSGWIAGAILCGVNLCQPSATRPRTWAVGFWACAALASFTKGWHGLIYPALILLVAGILIREWRSGLRYLLSWMGVLLFLAICVPWHLEVEARFPGFLYNLHFTEHAGHVIGSDAPATSYTVVPRWQFILLHMGWFFPWSIAAIAAIAWDFPAARQHVFAAVRSAPAKLFVAWAGVVILSVVVAGQRQDYYAMSMWSAVAGAIAVGFKRGWPKVSLSAVTGICVAGFIGSVVLISQNALGSAVGVASVASRATAWSTLAGLDSHVWRSLSWIGVVAFGLSAFCLLWGICNFRRLGMARASWLTMAAAGVVFSVSGVFGYAHLAPYFSLAPMQATLRDDLPANTMLVFDGGIDTGSSLMFYSDRPIHLLGQDPSLEFPVRQFGIGRDRFLSQSQFEVVWGENRPVALITESSHLEQLPVIRSGMVIERSGTQVLVLNPAAAAIRSPALIP